jgi:Fe-S cluster assembly protein SufD
MPTAISLPSILATRRPTPAIFPEWFALRQQSAWEKFLSLPAPKRGDENWRFSSMGELDFSSHTFPASELSCHVDELTASSQGTAHSSAKMVFCNDEIIHRRADLPAAVIFLPLAEALILHPELVEAHFMRRESQLGSAKFSALHAAQLRNGTFLYVPDDIAIEHPIEIHHWLHGENTASFPHTLVITGKNAKVRVIETFRSVTSDQHGLAIAVNDLIAGANSTLSHTTIQALNPSSKIITINESTVAAGANATYFLLSVGASWSRSESLSRLEGEAARSNMLAVSAPGGDQEYDQRTFQHHVKPGAFSDLLYKNVLHDESRTIFSGLIFVDEGAHRTDAYQTCRNLLMSDAAEANSMPGLEINADDVKCSHGSTSSQISEDEIFYLRARGIHPDAARQLIARGFCVDAVSRLEHEATEAMVLGFLDGKFSLLATGR